MKKKLVALTLLIIAVQMFSQATIAFAGPNIDAASSALTANTKDSSLSMMRSVYKVTEHPELDPYVFSAFDKIEANKNSHQPIIVYTGDYNACVAFRDYFNYNYGFTYDFRLTAYHIIGSNDYTVAFCDTNDMETKIQNYLTEVKKAKEIAAQLVGPDNDSTAYNIINWVHTNLKYDYSLHGKATPSEMLQSYYGFYDGSLTICKGFSMAVYQLCSINGVQSTTEVGTYHGGGHAWNTILMSDGIRYVDTLNKQTMVSDSLPAGYAEY